ncbi:glycosyltransferase [Pedobacter sp.]|uniref:glycosyltransferase n=1 Tax=Pedobacter sp. TaxID=1411316 RepID=UPI003D7F6406
MKENNILIIGLVWPEPGSSAAGTRIIQLIHVFLSAGARVTFASAASKSDFSYDLTQLGVTEQPITLNDPGFDTFIKDLNPSLVLFDRFMIEEQYGWRVQQECPDALRVLDTEDLHCLRHARQQAVKATKSLSTADLFTDVAKREIAAILRADLSLIISEVEMDILEQQFRIDPAIVYYLPFLEDELTENRVKAWNSFEDREGFTFIGNYLHEPNWHTLQTLKTQVWPVLRTKVPGAKLHIYGAYASQKVLQLHNEKERFLVHGRAADGREALAKHRVLLAPIQFGAGVKGKFIDAMQVGTPSVTTTMGAEAMKGDLEWNGYITDDPTTFLEDAASLYQNKAQWLHAQEQGRLIINERYSKTKFTTVFLDRIKQIIANLPMHRQQNFYGQLLQHHTANSTKYMSLWIQEKNKHQ